MNLFVIFISFCTAVDKLSFAAPDKYDIRLNENDKKLADIMYNKDQLDNDVSVEIQKKEDRLDSQVSSIKKQLDSENVYSMTSKNIWRMIYNHIKEHLEQFLKGRDLVIKMYMRYSFCTYIIPLLPTQYVLLFPGFWEIFIPKKLKQNVYISKFIKTLKKFLNEVKKRSKNELLPAFTFSKSISGEQDIEFFLEVPVLIKTDPAKIIRWLLDFKLADSSLDVTQLAQDKLNSKE